MSVEVCSGDKGSTLFVWSYMWLQDVHSLEELEEQIIL